MVSIKSTLSRREFLGTAGLVLLPRLAPAADGTVVNDVHSQLNATTVREVLRPHSIGAVQAAIRMAADRGHALSLAGGRHAMGGQQFGEATTLLDLRSLNRIRRFDPTKGTIEVEAGIQWPQLVAFLVDRQRGQTHQWGIAQKQTGADRLTIGGALSANAHGRGLQMAPFVSDIESFELVDASGAVRVCSRESEPELFRLAIGGYGLFGVVSAVTLRLTPRRKLQRVVELRSVEGLIDAFDSRLADGCIYGDFQYDIDPKSDGFMRRGVFSCYRAVPDATSMPTAQKELGDSDWAALLTLAHVDRTAAFDRYSSYYLSTNGRLYWSDLHQMSTYLDDYHVRLDQQMGAKARATEMITEIYVPRRDLPSFMAEVAERFRTNGVPIVYGTVRLIEQDDESFLAWARQPYACIIFNLHVVHTPGEIERSGEAFRDLIDMGIKRGGRYYLTYHRHARRDQVEACYPQLPQFLRLKTKYDPQERFQSEWYRHYKQMFAERI
jgi:FAD/FMN-containing dehydrogenase